MRFNLKNSVFIVCQAPSIQCSRIKVIEMLTENMTEFVHDCPEDSILIGDANIIIYDHVYSSVADAESPRFCADFMQMKGIIRIQYASAITPRQAPDPV